MQSSALRTVICTSHLGFSLDCKFCFLRIHVSSRFQVASGADPGTSTL